MKFILILIPILISCNIEKITPVFTEKNVSTKTIGKVIISNENSTYSIEKIEDEFKSTSPTQFPLVQDKVDDWFEEIQDIGTIDKPEVSFSIAGIKPRFMKIVSKDETSYSYDIEGYRFNGEWSYIRLQLIVNGKRKSQKAGYLRSDDFNKLFFDFNNLRKTKIELPSYDEIQYVVNNRKYSLNSSQEEKLKDLLSEFTATSYSHDGEVDNAILKNNRLGIYMNNNIQGFFNLLRDDFSVSLYIGRPDEVQPILRVWITGEQEILEGKFSKWPELKKLEKEILND
jgi:hypothetical protein